MLQAGHRLLAWRGSKQLQPVQMHHKSFYTMTEVIGQTQIAEAL